MATQGRKLEKMILILIPETLCSAILPPY